MIRADVDYEVVREKGGHGDIRGLKCLAPNCGLFISKAAFRKTGDRSGLPSYNRLRIAMMKHAKTHEATP